MQRATQRSNGRRPAQPETLMEAAVRRANEKHAERMAELKAAQKQLAAFEAFMPAVRAAGIDLHTDEINYLPYGKKCLRIASALLTDARNVTLERVLIENGMREVGRNTYSDGSYWVDLAKGHLRVALTVRPAANVQGTEAAK